MDKQALRGRDISAPMNFITIDGIQHRLVFSNETFRIVENVYERQYQKDAGIGEILDALTRQKYSATMAFLYAAMIAGGCEMEWAEFDEKFRLTNLDGLQELLLQGLGEALPDVEANQDPQAAPAIS